MVKPCAPHNLPAAQGLPAAPDPQTPVHFPGLSPDPNIRGRPLPGVRCPTCAANGLETWVIPGRACGYCGTPCF